MSEQHFAEMTLNLGVGLFCHFVILSMHMIGERLPTVLSLLANMALV